MEYTRLYADSGGETHFENVDVEFNDGQIRSGGPTMGLSAPQPSSDCFFLETTGGSTAFRDYHPSPRKQWFVVLSGSMEFGTSDGEVRKFESGAAILLDDMNTKGHITRRLEECNVMFVGLED